MGFPNIPNITPDISINREQVIDLLLASIALEELGLAHIINAEGEKIQRAIGTIPGFSPLATSINDLLTINQSVSKTLQDVIKKEMLLQFKFENILELITSVSCTPQTLTFSPTGQGRFGSLQTFTVPEGVCSLRIRAVGSIGGTGNTTSPNPGGAGGLGASIQGDFSVTPGETLSILVGQRGLTGDLAGGGGGGGSFVWRGIGFAALNLGSLLVAAGGGGGGGDSDETPGNPGLNATIPVFPSTSSNGTAGNPGGAGGVGGNGGAAGDSSSGGAGILTDGGDGVNGATGGQAIQAGGAGGVASSAVAGDGGFGGGGGASDGGAGGGGFNGGGGGNILADGDGGGGGGGSFNSGTNPINTAGVGSGDGTVVITTICC
jgi:hypothetical protein